MTVRFIDIETLAPPTDYAEAELNVMCQLAATLASALPERGGKLVVFEPPKR